MRKGGGLFKKTVNFFTRRKQPLRPRNLSEEETRRKSTLKTKKGKTPEETKELSALSAKLAPAEAVYQEELNARTRFQKFFNRFYTKQEKETLSPKELLRIPIEGISEVYKNSRKPFDKQRARIPNRNLQNAPAIEAEEYRMIDGKRIPLASQILVEYMNIPLLYAMWKQEPPKEKLEDIPDEDFQDFANVLKESLEADMEFDTVAREIFHMPGGIEEMNRWIKDHEEGRGYLNGEYRIQDYNQQQPDGSYRTIQVVMTPGAIQLARYVARMSSGKKNILRVKETNDQNCTGDSPENQRGSFVPLTTLNSNGCFVIFNGDMFDRIGSEFMSGSNRIPENAPKYYSPEMLRKNWIILEKKYFPIKSNPLLPIAAKYFGIASYIQEALDNWGIEGIDAYFLELLQLKYPQFAIKFTTYILNTQDFSYQRQKLKEFENFILLDKSIFPEVVGFTARNPFQESSKMFPYIQEAVTGQKLYGMSTYMAYAMKKLALPLWKQAFPSEAAKRNLAVYEGLTDQEKITVDYLEHLNFEERLVDSGYDFAQARDSYNQELGSGNTREGVIEETLSNYMSTFEKHKRHLLFYQAIVTQTYKGDVFDPKASRDDILHLLMKFVARNSSGLSVGAPANNGPRLRVNVVNEAKPRVNVANEPPRRLEVANEPPRRLEVANEPLPREIVWGTKNENENLPPLRKINLRPVSGFGANRNAGLNKTRKRKAELESYLEKAQRAYSTLAPRLPELEARSRFLTAKKRYNRLSPSELKNLRNFQTLQEFSTAKQIAERELKQLQASLNRR